MVAQHRRRWANIEPTLGKRFVFAGMLCWCCVSADPASTQLWLNVLCLVTTSRGRMRLCPYPELKLARKSRAASPPPPATAKAEVTSALSPSVCISISHIMSVWSSLTDYSHNTLTPTTGRSETETQLVHDSVVQLVVRVLELLEIQGTGPGTLSINYRSAIDLYRPGRTNRLKVAKANKAGDVMFPVSCIGGLSRGEHVVSLDMKGCICHFAKWHIHLFISKATKFFAASTAKANCSNCSLVYWAATAVCFCKPVLCTSVL